MMDRLAALPYEQFLLIQLQENNLFLEFDTNTKPNSLFIRIPKK